MKEENIEV